MVGELEDVFDEVSLAYFEGDLIGLVDLERWHVTPVRQPTLRVSSSSDGILVSVVDCGGKTFRYRSTLRSEEDANGVIAAWSTLFVEAAARRKGAPFKAIAEGLPFANQAGLQLELSVHNRWLSPLHSYWLYFIFADNADFGRQTFQLLVAKERFPDKADADVLATTDAIAEVKGRLENANRYGRPLLIGSVDSGWTVI